LMRSVSSGARTGAESGISLGPALPRRNLWLPLKTLFGSPLCAHASRYEGCSLDRSTQDRPGG
jgi:hypothetical protein